MVKLLPLLILGLGVFVFSQALFPIVSYKLWEVAYLNASVPLVNPVAPINTNVLGASIAPQGNFPAIVSGFQRTVKLPYDHFLLNINKLNIKEAQVQVDSNELDQSLAHLPGSALPGEIGNVFISGHSNLFPFFASADYYKSVFINLPKLQKDDEVSLTVGGQKFIYKVQSMRIVDPTDLSVVDPPDPVGRYLTLMTCVPPGINTRRLTVLTKLQ